MNTLKSKMYFLIHFFFNMEPCDVGWQWIITLFSWGGQTTPWRGLLEAYNIFFFYFK